MEKAFVRNNHQTCPKLQTLYSVAKLCRLYLYMRLYLYLQQISQHLQLVGLTTLLLNSVAKLCHFIHTGIKYMFSIQTSLCNYFKHFLLFERNSLWYVLKVCPNCQAYYNTVEYITCKTMEIVHVYTKVRHEFGRQCTFSNRPAELHVNVIPEPHLTTEFIERDPCDNAVQCVHELSEHEVSVLAKLRYYILMPVCFPHQWHKMRLVYYLVQLPILQIFSRLLI